MVEGIEEAIEGIRHITTDIPPELEEKLKDIKEHIVLQKGNNFISYNIVLAHEEILEIGAGTKLFFGEKNVILAYGPLIAIATEEEQITFTGDKEKGWGNISFIESSSN